MSNKHEIFFSYAWNDDRAQASGKEKVVYELYHSLLRDHFRIIRDNYNLQYEGLISDFISSIRQGKSIIIALSEQYLKSHYCMVELYEIAIKSHLDKEKFTDRVLPVMVEFIDFTKPATIDYYLSYWANEYRVWDKLLKTHSGTLSAEQLQQYHNVKLIFRNLGMMTEWIVEIDSLHDRILPAGDFAEIKRELHNRALETGSVLRGPVARKWITRKRFWVAMVGITIVLLAAFRLISPWGSIPTKDPYFVNQGKIEEVSNSDTAHTGRDTQEVKISTAGRDTQEVKISTQASGESRQPDTSTKIKR